MPRQLILLPAPAVPGPAVLDRIEPALRACLDGGPPLAVLPAGPPAAVAGARAVIEPDRPLERGTDLVVVTSGSTGRARGVLLSASALRASAEATLERLGGPGAWLLALPVSAIAGLQVLCRGIVAGRRPAVLTAGERLTSALERLPGDGARYTALVPTQLRRFLDAEPAALRAFDAVLVGGAAADPALLARARAEDVAVVTTYGMTETAGGCVYEGRPLPGVHVQVADAGIQLTGPVLALGYRGDPEATAAAFANGWFSTADAGSLDAQGRLTVHGRLDDVVVTGGINVGPAAVEAVLREHTDVADAVVFGRSDQEWGQRVVAAVVLSPGALPALADLRPWVRERLGAAAAPRELHVIPAVPLLHTGKPDRRAVAAAVLGG